MVIRLRVQFVQSTSCRRFFNDEMGAPLLRRAWITAYSLGVNSRPRCGRRPSRFANYCPHCDAHLPFGGTFTPGKTAVAKALSWILLVVFIGSMAILFGRIVQQMVEAGRG